jgi:copper chaperone NosL
MRAYVLFFFLLSLLLAGCAQGTTTIGPPEIHYGEDQCRQCGMIISDPRFACAFLREVSQGHYESLTFDDIGDMLAYAQKQPTQAVVAWYVHDYASQEWLDATKAYFVSSAEVQTPMGHGIAAHATRASAQAMAAEKHGEVLDWPALWVAHDHADHTQ